MNKLIVIIAILFAVFVGVVFFQFNGFGRNAPTPTEGVTATIKDQTYKVTVVTTQQDQQIGLSKYSTLPQDQAMLFQFPKKDFYSFWMKDMKFPIDIIFIDGDTIVSIAQKVPAPKSAEDDLPLYQPDSPVDKVLEINAGLAEKNGYKKGDNVTIKQ